MNKSFEKVWKEYLEHKYNEVKHLGFAEIVVSELDDRKEYFMDFYCYLKLCEEI